MQLSSQQIDRVSEIAREAGHAIMDGYIDMQAREPGKGADQNLVSHKDD